MESFKVDLRAESDATVVSVSGYLNEEAGKDIISRIEPILETGKVLVVIDLANCEMIGSPGVVTLLTLALRVTEDFLGVIVIANPKPIISEVFVLAGLSSIAPIVNGTEAALQKGRELILQ